MKKMTAALKPFFAILLLAVFARFGAKAQDADANVQNTVVSSQPSYANIALGKTATASSTDNGSHAASYAIDGSMATRFASAYDDNQWLSVDLGKAYLISTVLLTWEKSYGKDFNLLFSNNGTFTDLYNDSIQIRNHVLTTNSVAGTDTIKMKAGTVARYVRMQGIHRATGNGYSIWEMQVMGATSSSGLFPVSVTGFTATPAQNNSALLEWSTITEYGNAGFTIERSNDGLNFNAIGWLAGRNTGTVINKYSFTDQQLAGGKNYYRLKQTWMDGRSGYSPVITVNAGNNSNAISLYPVPVKDHLTVEYKGTAGENINIALLNTVGLPVYNSKLVAQGGQQTITINRTANMKAGQYFLSIISENNKKYTGKIILQ